MFWAIAAGAIDTRGFEFEQVLQDIQTLNEWALEGRLEVTAISLHAYPFVQDRYALLPHGASIGSGYGPILVAREPLTLRAAARRRDRRPRADDDGVPRRCGSRSASSRTASCRSTAILDEVSSGRADAGLVIHEGQLTYERRGPAQGARPRRVVAARDRAAAAARRQRRRAATSATGCTISRRCCSSRSRPGSRTAREAMRYAMRFGRGIDARHDRPLRRHVRQRADVRLRRRGPAAVEELLRRGEAIGAFPEPVRLDYVS